MAKILAKDLKEYKEINELLSEQLSPILNYYSTNQRFIDVSGKYSGVIFKLIDWKTKRTNIAKEIDASIKVNSKEAVNYKTIFVKDINTFIDICKQLYLMGNSKVTEKIKELMAHAGVTIEKRRYDIKFVVDKSSVFGLILDEDSYI